MAYIESVIIRDTGGTEADVTAANALKVDGSAVTQPVNIVAGSVTANVELQQDVFGQLVIANRYNQFEINYDSTDPDSITEITVTKTSGGDASNSAGQAVFTSNANTNGGVKAVTNLTVTYRPNSETYAAFTAIWASGGLANSHQRIGIYDANNGFYIGYEGVNFGITLRKGGVDTFTAKASWNVDTLTGAVGSKYTRNGVPEAIDFTKDNLFRIRYGWLGAAPIYWEVLSPDGEWVLFDIYRHPNTTGGTTINNPDLPMTLDIQKTAAGATVLTMNTACWAAGTTSPYTKISSTITDNTLANMSRSVITGRASTGGGTYYNVKVTPSGAIVTAGADIYPEDSAHASGNDGSFILAVRNDSNAAMTSADGDYSPIAVNANGAVAINDGGNSITVDGSVTASVSGTVAATQSGAWSVDVNNGAGAAAVNIQDGGNSITVDNSGTFAVQITSGGPTQYAEDTAHSSGDLGFQFLGVRNDAAAAPLTSTNGDYSPVSTDQYGKLFTVSERVHNTAHTAADIGSFILAVRNDGAANQAATSNNTYASFSVDEYGKQFTADNKVEDSVHTSGDQGSFILGVRNDSNSAMTSTNGDYSPIAVNANGAVAINDGGNSITVDGTVTATIAASKREDLPHTSTDDGLFILAVRNDAAATVVTSTDGDYSQISTDERGRVITYSEQTPSQPYLRGMNVIGGIDKITGNAEPEYMYVLPNGNALAVGITDKNGDFVFGEKLIETHYNEDASHTDTDYGNFILGVRNDTNAVVTSADGDYSQISVNDKGAVAIQDGGNSITVDGTVGVSGTVTVSGTVAATQSGTWVLGANSGVDIGDVTVNNAGGASAVNIQDGGNSITVDGTVAFSNTTIAVTNAGTFAVQAAQSGTWVLGANSGVDIGDVTINNAAGASAVNIQDGGNSITVDGTVAATQSGTWILGANPGVDIGDVTINNASGASAVNIQDGGNSITVDGTVTVTPPTLTKGTQGATGFSTQDLKDAGRTAVRYYATAAAAGTTTTETAITLTKSSGTSATSTGTSFVITSGKTFRIEAITFATRGNNTATAQTTTFNFRINTGGAVTTTTTPIILAMRSATPATANAWDRVFVTIPDGMEIEGNGTLQFGITAAATYTTNAPTWDVTIIGFEY